MPDNIKIILICEECRTPMIAFRSKETMIVPQCPICMETNYRSGQEIAFEKGMAQGKNMGYEDGYEKGYSKGYDEGYSNSQEDSDRNAM